MNSIKALSIKQPWAWLIQNGYKSIENRNWRYMPRNYGPLYIHASKGCTKREYAEVVEFVKGVDPSIKIPPLDQLQRGGLVAKCVFTGCVKSSKDPWFFGPLGLVFEHVEPIDFVECKGQLGFFLPKTN